MDTPADCPLCHQPFLSLIQLRRHMGQHYEQLALFAIPPNLGETEDDSEAGSNKEAEKESIGSGRTESEADDGETASNKEAPHDGQTKESEELAEDAIDTGEGETVLDEQMAYQGWVLRRCPRENLDPGMEPSWKYCIPHSPMGISAKALVAQVKEHLTTYAKEKITVQNVFDKLTSEYQRLQIEALIDDQNIILQEYYPDLEWVLETIEVEWQQITDRKSVV